MECRLCHNTLPKTSNSVDCFNTFHTNCRGSTWGPGPPERTSRTACHTFGVQLGWWTWAKRYGGCTVQECRCRPCTETSPGSSQSSSKSQTCKTGPTTSCGSKCQWKEEDSRARCGYWNRGLPCYKRKRPHVNSNWESKSWIGSEDRPQDQRKTNSWINSKISSNMTS